VADAFAGWLILRGDVAEAQDLADRLVADAGDADTLAVASNFERTVKRPERAITLAERASKLGLPAGRRALLLGAAALAKEDQALGKDGDAHGDPRLILTRAAVDERRGDWQRAVARGEQLLARKPRSVEALNFVGFVAADHDHDMARTLRRIQAAVVLSPGSGAIIDSLGWAYFKTGDLARADVYLEQAARLEPGDPEVLEHLGDL